MISLAKGTAGGAHISERKAAAAIRRHFSAAWFVAVRADSPPRHISMIPDGCAELVWSDGTLCVFGPGRSSRIEVARPGSTFVGLRFTPGAAPLWLRMPAGELLENRVPLDSFDSQRANMIYQAIDDTRDPETIASRMEAAITVTAAGCEVPHPCLYAVLDLLYEGRFAPGGLIRDLQDLFNMSERTVRRHTERFFGYGPKTLERIFRLQRFVHLAQHGEERGLAELAVASGYADQAHLTRDARELTGLTPKVLMTQPAHQRA